MRLRVHVAGARTVLLGALLLAAAFQVREAGGDPEAPPRNGPAADTPAIAAIQLALTDGETVSLGDLLSRGPVLLDFWATWCKPCAASVPALQSLHERLRGEGFTVVGISVDGPRNFSKVRPFATRMGITYPIALDRDGSLQRYFQVAAVPTAILLDGEGRVARVQQGFRPGEETEMESAVRALLSGAVRSGAGLPGGGR